MATCYLLTQCDGLVDPFIVSNDLSNFVGQTIKICPADLPQLSTPTGGIPIPPYPNDPYNSLYDLVDCCGIQPSITIKNSAGSLVNYIVNLPSIGSSTCWTVKKSTLNIQPAVIVDTTGGTYFTSCNICTQNAPCAQNLPVLTECLCFTVSEAQTCEGAINLVSVGISYQDCYYCKGPCYKLTDCEGVLADIITNTDISEYVGSIIKIDTCPDTCWTVSFSDACTGAIALPTIAGYWASCAECLPPVLPPPPVELITRRVKPGYYTKGCPPEYTEKISCKFGDTMFDDVARVRYGITICCDHDVEKWWIKKELLNLKAIYDPALDCPPKRCYCYTIEQAVGTTEFKYVNCDGDCTSITLLQGDTQYVCSQTWPNAICPAEGSLYTITNSQEDCLTNADCLPACQCLNVTGNSEFPNVFQYQDCATGVIKTITLGFTETIDICSVQDTYVVIDNDPVAAINGSCTTENDCITCISVTATASTNFRASKFSYTDCLGNYIELNLQSGQINEFCCIPDTFAIISGDIVFAIDGPCVT